MGPTRPRRQLALDANLLFDLSLLPPDEFNDGLILAETALAEIPILVTSDKHLLDIDETALRLTFDEADLLHAIPCYPRALLHTVR
jgi:hypothetical protein